MVVEHKRELARSEDFLDFSDFAPRLFRLPLADVDATSFLDALTVVTMYLLDEKFVQATVSEKLIDKVWELLTKTEARMKSDREE